MPAVKVCRAQMTIILLTPCFWHRTMMCDDDGFSVKRLVEFMLQKIESNAIPFDDIGRP
ncbi:hypothetical protein D3C80_2222170 [compost metagenome]